MVSFGFLLFVFVFCQNVFGSNMLVSKLSLDQLGFLLDTAFDNNESAQLSSFIGQGDRIVATWYEEYGTKGYFVFIDGNSFKINRPLQLGLFGKKIFISPALKHVLLENLERHKAFKDADILRIKIQKIEEFEIANTFFNPLLKDQGINTTKIDYE